MPSTRPIVDTLREIRHGAMLEDASEELAKIVRRVAETGKPGSLTMKLVVRPTGRGSVRTLVIEDQLMTKIPQPDREVTIFFPTADGNLTRNDPSQMSLGLRSVESVDPETGLISGAAS